MNEQPRTSEWLNFFEGLADSNWCTVEIFTEYDMSLTF